MYKVFIQDKPIFFISPDEITNNDGIFIRSELARQHQDYVFRMVAKLPAGVALYILSEDPSAEIGAFFSDYQMVEAAGGIVKRKDEFLFIKRNGLWDLPKGKMEDGESPEVCAKREIEEECGIEGPEVKELVLITYHTYAYKDIPTIKKTYWYALTYDGPKKGTPQLEEGITRVSWKKEEKMDKALQKTYASIVDVVRTYFKS